MQLWNSWEVQVLVLCSFTLQVFLLCSGSLRRRSTSMFLRLCIWIGFLAADFVAVYVLGFLSRKGSAGSCSCRGGMSAAAQEAHPLAFIWAPFLLIHLGGQDTVTALAVADHKLWLRHLLNLVVQVALSLYVFWKSVGTAWHDDVRPMAAGVFVFVAGVIKYVERTVALKYGKLRSLEGFLVNGGILTEDAAVKGFRRCRATACSHTHSDAVRAALQSMAGVRGIFAGHTIYQMNESRKDALTMHYRQTCPDLELKLLEIELALMYDDLYTKATVLRTRTGIIARCVSLMSIAVALALFLVVSKHKYNRVDVAITYLLFIGGFSFELCATLMVMASPWTWAWFEARSRRCQRIAGVSWWLLAGAFGWPKDRPLWSKSVGQYNFLSYVGQYKQPSGPCRQQLMKIIRKTVNFVGAGKDCLFSISEVLDTRFVEVDDEIMGCIAGVVQGYLDGSHVQQQFRNIRTLLRQVLAAFRYDFGAGIVLLHVFMVEQFSRYPTSAAANHRDDSAETTDAVVEICRKLSNYMIHLFVSKPEMLPVSGATEATLKSFCDKIDKNNARSNGGDFLSLARTEFNQWRLPENLDQCRETANEMRVMWVRLLVYAAGKSRPEMHAEQLAGGGELLTFVWLLMAHKGLGDSGNTKIELIASKEQGSSARYVFPQ